MSHPWPRAALMLCALILPVAAHAQETSSRGRSPFYDGLRLEYTSSAAREIVVVTEMRFSAEPRAFRIDRTVRTFRAGRLAMSYDLKPVRMNRRGLVLDGDGGLLFLDRFQSALWLGERQRFHGAELREGVEPLRVRASTTWRGVNVWVVVAAGETLYYDAYTGFLVGRESEGSAPIVLTGTDMPLLREVIQGMRGSDGL